jgi:hypothetical protein
MTDLTIVLGYTDSPIFVKKAKYVFTTVGALAFSNPIAWAVFVGTAK